VNGRVCRALVCAGPLYVQGPCLCSYSPFPRKDRHFASCSVCRAMGRIPQTAVRAVKMHPKSCMDSVQTTHLAGGWADASRELREVVCLQQPVQCLPPAPLVHQVIELRDLVAWGAGCVGGGGGQGEGEHRTRQRTVSGVLRWNNITNHRTPPAPLVYTSSLGCCCLGAGGEGGGRGGLGESCNRAIHG
jgi:hypothetical protein